ncbi:hypothetical protein E1171_18060 [Cytophagales bacterium RKSG123]|nr:hypothetical protein [Xanthovirga aplysinae]
MELTKIESLLEKYYEGESCLEEEKILLEYFAHNTVPEYLVIDQLHFRYYYRPAGQPSPKVQLSRKSS